MDFGLAGRRALVVGASQGLGRAIAASLLAEGAHVAAAARSVAKIEAWVVALPDGRGRVTVHALDLADMASVDRLADAVLAAGGVDILVNNCGGPAPSTVLDTAAEAWPAAFGSMATAVFRLTDRLVKPMMARGWGRVVTIGSSGIEQPIPSLAVSNVIRSSVAAWSKSLANEVAAHGVTVNMVLPGRIATERVDSLDRSRAERQAITIDAVRANNRADIPAGRYGTPAEFAAVVTFLASAPASYVTGSMIRVDGGAIRAP